MARRAPLHRRGGSSAPAVLIGQVAAATSRIRVGSGTAQPGHQTTLAVVEQFGTLDALFPGRIDLGLGRSGQRQAEAARELAADSDPPRPGWWTGCSSRRRSRSPS
ncbi:LLM class flavin-dependent oxidoreductase [Plantactinospora sp. ZYX-F-223]|uniref:LLM class flavin-dependent oxidoreductase n=1 Tax=Plantactinospora sp. ZYX-F-223 TaxID=3144103 RepID=UPI0031FDC58C